MSGNCMPRGKDGFFLPPAIPKIKSCSKCGFNENYPAEQFLINETGMCELCNLKEDENE